MKVPSVLNDRCRAMGALSMVLNPGIALRIGAIHNNEGRRFLTTAAVGRPCLCVMVNRRGGRDAVLRDLLLFAGVVKADVVYRVLRHLVSHRAMVRTLSHLRALWLHLALVDGLWLCLPFVGLGAHLALLDWWPLIALSCKTQRHRARRALFSHLPFRTLSLTALVRSKWD
jgi:hypothetical protein